MGETVEGLGISKANLNKALFGQQWSIPEDLKAITKNRSMHHENASQKGLKLANKVAIT